VAFTNYLAQLLMSLPPGEWVNNTSRVQGLIKSLVRARVSVQLCFLPHRRQYARLTLEDATIAEQEDFQVGASWHPWIVTLTSIPSQQWRLGRVTCLSVSRALGRSTCCAGGTRAICGRRAFVVNMTPPLVACKPLSTVGSVTMPPIAPRSTLSAVWLHVP
jgi:hypothetical protein